jgi:hypothetical protein
MNKVFVLVAALCLACAGEKKKSDSSEWKELESFHKLMAAVFHPLDSGNLEPAKKLASQLAEEADHWASSTLPENVNNSEMKKKLVELKKSSRALSDEVGNGSSDDVLKEKLATVHQQFHEIMEEWHGNGPDEEREHAEKDEDEEDDD